MLNARRPRPLRSLALAAAAAVIAGVLAPTIASADETTAPAATTSAEVTTTGAPAPSETPQLPQSTEASTNASTTAPATAPPTETPTSSAPEAAPTSDAPLAADAAPAVESGDTVVGELVQAWPDPTADEAAHSDHAGEEPLTWVQPAEGDAVRVPTEDAPDVRVGSTVSVTVGEEVIDEASAEQGAEPAREVLAASVVQVAPADPTTAAAGTALTNSITVVMVRPGGVPIPQGAATLTTVVDQLNGPVADFWSNQSDATVRLGVTAQYDWRTTTETCSNAAALWREVATSIGWSSTGSDGKHLMLYVPPGTPNCSYGLGTVGSSIGSGGFSYVADAETPVMAHELGHNFGLGHSSEYQCDGTIEVGTCQTRAYYDLYDVMGISWNEVGTLNVVQAARLGLLPAAEAAVVTPTSSATTVTLVPVSSASGTRAVRVRAADGTTYWLEYRQAVGQDVWLGDNRNAYGLPAGVVLRRAAALPDTSLLLDASPSAAAGWSGDLKTTLPVGVAAVTSGNRFSIVVQSQTSSTAVVRITPGVLTAIDAKYAAAGGPDGSLGTATQAEYCGLAGGGCFRTYVNGSIYWSPGTGARVVSGPLLARWRTLGYEVGQLGYPVSDTACGLVDSGCFQVFQGGSLYDSASTAAQLIRGGIRERYAATGWEVGPLGYPTGDENCGLRAGGCFQTFQRGSVYWSPLTGARALTGAVASRWAAMGYENGGLGYPVSDTACGLVDSGCFQVFQGGSLYGSASTGVHRVIGAIRDRWAASGWEVGPLGYPTGEETCSSGSCVQTFQRGSIRWASTTGAVLVS